MAIALDKKLCLHGNATDHIWIMVDGDEPNVIGVRMDCGDSGTVYMSRDQAKDLVEQLQDVLQGNESPWGSG
jgi:hypothetical protein